MHRRPGLRGLPFRVLVPLIAAVETSRRIDPEGPLQGTTATATWNVVRVLAVAAVVVLAGLAWRSRAAAARVAPDVRR